MPLVKKKRAKFPKDLEDMDVEAIKRLKELDLSDEITLEDELDILVNRPNTLLPKIYSFHQVRELLALYKKQLVEEWNWDEGDHLLY